MYQRLWHIILFALLTQLAIAQDQEVLMLQPGDTLYKSIDLLPESILIAPNTQTGFWDFSSLLAPYVHEVYIRPVTPVAGRGPKADLVMMDADGTERFATVSEGGISLAAFRTLLDGKSRFMGICKPTILWRSNTPALGDSDMYEGACIFNIPEERKSTFGLPVGWSGDSIRLNVAYQIASEMDAFGAMVTPSGQYVVIRERRSIKSTAIWERRQDGRWLQTDFASDIELPAELQPGTIHTFWSSNLPEPVASVYSDASDKIKSVEFRATPYGGGRIVKHFPKVADVFVYPNPSFGEVRFDFVNLDPGEYTLEIYNILGVKQRTLGPVFIDSDRTVAMDLSDLKKGTYVYRLVDKNQNALRSKRLVIITP